MKLLSESCDKIREEIKGYLELVIALHNELNWQQFFYFVSVAELSRNQRGCKHLLVKVRAHACLFPFSQAQLICNLKHPQ